MSFSRLLIRATNWVGDAVMSLPALHAIRHEYPDAHITILARPWVAGLYMREPFADEVITYEAPRGARGIVKKWALSQQLRRGNFDAAILLQNAFEAAALVRLAGIPQRIGYNRDARGFLLTVAVTVPELGETPRHEQFYYLELLKRAGLIPEIPPGDTIRLHGRVAARNEGLRKLNGMGIAGPVIGVSPGAAYGTAKRWLPERFAESSAEVARDLDASVALFGSKDERELCAEIAEMIRARGQVAHEFAGKTSLQEFIDLVAACRVFLTNDSGAMHIASALEVPTVAVFGATDHRATGPTGPLAEVIRQHVECSPCLLRECPIDHRCMTAVATRRVVASAVELIQLHDSAIQSGKVC